MSSNGDELFRFTTVRAPKVLSPQQQDSLVINLNADTAFLKVTQAEEKVSEASNLSQPTKVTQAEEKVSEASNLSQPTMEDATSEAKFLAPDAVRRNTKHVLARPLDVAQIRKLHELIKDVMKCADVAAAKQVIQEKKQKTVYKVLKDLKDLRKAAAEYVIAFALIGEQRTADYDMACQMLRVYRFLTILSKQPDQEKPWSANQLSKTFIAIPEQVMQLKRALAKPYQAPPVSDDLMERLQKLDAMEKSILRLREERKKFIRQQKQTKQKQSEKGFEAAQAMITTLRETAKEEKDKPKPVSADADAHSALPVGLKQHSQVSGDQTTLATEMTIKHLQLPNRIVPPMDPKFFGAGLNMQQHRIATPKLGEIDLGDLKTHVDEHELAELKETDVDVVIPKLRRKNYEAARSVVQSLTREQILRLAKENPHYLEMLKKFKVPFGPDLNVGVVVDTKEDVPAAPKHRVKVLGVGDLRVVEDRLSHYEEGALAHIENVLKGEKKVRIHKTTEEREETREVETVEEKEEEHELQTQERTEVRQQVNQTIQSETKREAGVALSGSYGTVKLEAHADFAMNDSSNTSSQTAKQFAKDVTERSRQRAAESRRQQIITRELHRIEETNKHILDNTGANGTDHVVGMYQFVNEIHRAYLINKGAHLMLEFIIPDPAAYYRYITLNGQSSKSGLTNLEAPKIEGKLLTPDLLDEDNYLEFVAKYQLKDIKRPPDPVQYLSIAIIKEPKEATGFFTIAEKNIELKIPVGYTAVDFSQVYIMFIHAGVWSLFVSVAGKVLAESMTETYNPDDPKTFIHYHDVTFESDDDTQAPVGITDVAPITLIAKNLHAVEVNLVVKCRRTEESFKAWQHATYIAIMGGYQAALERERQAENAARVRAGINITGRNPGINRQLERNELKKHSLRLLTDGYTNIVCNGHEFGPSQIQFDAMQYSSTPPEFSIVRASQQGPVIQYFEQAFLWPDMTYLFYPYMWAHRSKWPELMAAQDIDPKFTDFLRAGAARTVVPVRHGYEESILKFITMGQIEFSEVGLTNLLYVSIVAEIRANSGNTELAKMPVRKPDEEPADTPYVEDSWEYELPTMLMFLLKEGLKLPDFRDKLPHLDYFYGLLGKQPPQQVVRREVDPHAPRASRCVVM